MIILGADHAGFPLKKQIIEYLNKNKLEFYDVTNYELIKDDDYTDIALDISNKVLENSKNKGIAICGTGIGICIACNKVKGIRSANCFNEYTAKMSRLDNDANVLCLGGRNEISKNFNNIEKILEIFFKTSFGNGRHLRRINKIKELEEKFGDQI